MAGTTLTELFATGLPINRKERYYTGTVLPALLCAHSMRCLHRLTDYLGLAGLDIRTRPADCRRVFTEYSAVESAIGSAKADSAALSGAAKGTPDVVILITEPKPTLIALEAKMFDRPSLPAMEQQISAQRTHLNALAADLAQRLGAPAVDVRHWALLPHPLAKDYQEVGRLSVPVVEWEWIRDNYADVDQEDFHAILQHGLANYEQLKSTFSRATNTVRFVVTGS